MCKINRYYAQINNDCAFPLVPAIIGKTKSTNFQNEKYKKIAFTHF